ncbi:MAG: hypothetical protein H7Y41_07200 [Hyphomonadaceae bacterium]|nr:hypothetical protein [Clostridia bacterium]
MLQKILLTEIPKVENSQQKSHTIKSNYLFDFVKIDALDALIAFEELQILLGMMEQQEQIEIPIIIFLPNQSNLIETLTSPFVQASYSIFEDIRLNIKDDIIVNLYLRKPSIASKKAFELLVQQNKLNPFTKTMFKKNVHVYNTDDCEAYAYIANVCKNDDSSVNKLLSLKYLNFFYLQCVRNGGMYGMPLVGWGLKDLEQCAFIAHLKEYFHKVIFVGAGKEWVSTHLILSEPIHFSIA